LMSLQVHTHGSRRSTSSRRPSGWREPGMWTGLQGLEDVIDDRPGAARLDGELTAVDQLRERLAHGSPIPPP
jgi:hypothetical protein